MRADEMIITLSAVPGIGERTVLQVLSAAGKELPNQVKDLHGMLIELRMANRRIKAVELSELEESYRRAQEIRSRCDDMKIKIVTLVDQDYPLIVADVPRPAPILYMRGDINALQRMSVAVIGTRKPNDYAVRVAHKFGLRFAESEFAVVSGLAIGCDTHAHRGCLEAQGVGVVVLPCGLDRVYPRQNTELAESLQAHGGCLVSEYPPGSETTDFRLVARDRLQASLSEAVVVVQSSINGGSMHAARYALDKIDRPVAALDPNMVGKGDFTGNMEIISHPNGRRIGNAADLQTFMAQIHNKRDVDAVLFDLDMTLIDSSRLAPMRDRHDWSAVSKSIGLIELYPGVTELIQAIRDRGLKVGIVSSAPKFYIERTCHRFGWNMDVTIGFHDCQTTKPDSGPLCMAAELLGIATNRCIYVGDSEIDMLAAQSALMPFYAAGWSEQGLDLSKRLIGVKCLANLFDFDKVIMNKSQRKHRN